MPAFTNEFDFFEAEVHAIIAGSRLRREDTFDQNRASTSNWYFLDLGDAHWVEENDGGGRSSWRLDMVIVVMIYGGVANASLNALKAASNGIVADLMSLFETHRYKERAIDFPGDRPYNVRVQDIKITTPVGVLADTATQGWAVINGEIHYDRSQGG